MGEIAEMVEIVCQFVRSFGAPYTAPDGYIASLKLTIYKCMAESGWLVVVFAQLEVTLGGR